LMKKGKFSITEQGVNNYSGNHKIKVFVWMIGVLLIANTALNPCTFFMSTLNGVTFFGNNEDSPSTSWPTNVWFIPATEDKHGYVYFGYNNGYPQGGMNDQGLCFDGASTPPSKIQFSPDKKPAAFFLIDRIMEECSYVDQVIEIVKTHRFNALKMQGQLLFADKKGDAAIVGGPDKNNDIDIIRKKGKFMVCTNFFPNNPQKGGYPCRRNETATRMLKENPEPSVENFRSILKAVSVSRTSYSNIFDLSNQIIFIYHFHNFSNVVKMKLEDELKEGPHAYRIPRLFSSSNRDEGLKELNEEREKGRISRRIPEFIAYKGGN